MILKHRGPFASRSARVGAVAFLVIASIAGLAVAILSRSPRVHTLVDAALANPYPPAVAVRNTTDGADYNRAFELYTHKNYVQAALYFEKAEANHPDLATIHFYNGLSALHSGHYNRAVKHLSSRVVSTSRYAQQGRWYLSLAYLKAGNTAAAFKLLDQMAITPAHFMHDHAFQLLNVLPRK